MDPGQLLAQFSSSLASQGITFTPTGKKRASPALTFTLYTASYGLTTMDLALGGDSTHAYMILLQSPFAEHDSLYQAVFLPVLDALRPK